MTELYADEFVRFDLVMSPASKGHIKVLPAKNVASLQDLSEEECVQLFYGASYVATALFELLGAHGTNILLSETIDGVSVDVVARHEQDGLELLWQPTQGNPAELDNIASAIKDTIDELLWAKDNPSAAKKSSAPAPAQELEQSPEGKVNYLLKSLRRTP